jgi:filamentous hemagglutinin family protein
MRLRLDAHRAAKQVAKDRPKSLHTRRAGTGLTALAGTTLVVVSSVGMANPKGGVVNAGTATIQNTSPNQLDIVQSTNRAVIDWQSFDIAVGERTNFQQPSAASMTLNRVHAPDPSTIAGQLNANGSLVLINPNGVVFSRGSQVNVNSIIATPTDISNANFMAGNMRFDRPSPNPNAQVINNGSITVAQKGLAALVAPGVANSGVIQANLGRVVLAGAETFTVDFYGDGLINFDVGPQLGAVPPGASIVPVFETRLVSGLPTAPRGTAPSWGPTSKLSRPSP